MQVSDLFGTSKFCFMAMLIAIPSFLLGTTVSLYAGVDCSEKSDRVSVSADNEVIIERKVHELLKEREDALLSKHTALVHKMVEQECESKAALAAATTNAGGGGGKLMFDPDQIGGMFSGMAVTPKENFTNIIDLGVPLDKVKKDSSHVLMLYSREKAMPTSLQQDAWKQTLIPEVMNQETVENCDYLNVLLVDHSKGRNQCLALVPQYEAYHLQHFMRAPLTHSGLHGKLTSSEPLRLVSRGLTAKGREEFSPPSDRVTQNAFSMLKNYFNSLETVTKDLKAIIKNDMKPYDNKIIIVMVCNFGQSELLMNFVCDAKSKGFDVSSVLVFATDQETADLAKALGLAAYYDEHNFGNIPAEAAHSYGDVRFSAMMVAKVVCVQLISHLGYDFLFQDVDIVWYQHPLRDYFAKPDHWSQKYDAIFQDDGAHSVRYSPYSANSGFYFVRHNGRTRSFVNTLLSNSAMVFQSDSHQQAMVAVLNEQVSLYGLKVKVVHRDENDLPGGYQWNMKTGKYMKAFFSGEMKPIIFHMSWTKNKDNKIKYFQQMGSWFVEDKCIAKKINEISGAAGNLVSTCCAAQPLFKCHYKDKPSVHPCKDSPNIDAGKASFW